MGELTDYLWEGKPVTPWVVKPGQRHEPLFLGEAYTATRPPYDPFSSRYRNSTENSLLERK